MLETCLIKAAIDVRIAAAKRKYFERMVEGLVAIARQRLVWHI